MIKLKCNKCSRVVNPDTDDPVVIAHQLYCRPCAGFIIHVAEIKQAAHYLNQSGMTLDLNPKPRAEASNVVAEVPPTIEIPEGYEVAKA